MAMGRTAQEMAVNIGEQSLLTHQDDAVIIHTNIIHTNTVRSSNNVGMDDVGVGRFRRALRRWGHRMLRRLFPCLSPMDLGEENTVHYM